MDSCVPGPSLPAILLALAFGAMAILPAKAGSSGQSPVDLFVNLAGDGPDLAIGAGAASSGRIAFDGIPLRVGIAEGPADLGWHMVAGARGRHTFALADGIDLITRGRATRTTFFDDPAQDRAAASGAAELHIAAGGWRLGLTQGVAVTRWEAGRLQRDATVEGRVARPITGHLGLAASGRYRWRVADGAQAFHSEATGGRVGFTYRLPAATKLELGYSARREAWSAERGYLGPSATFSRGPSLALALPLARGLDVSASYSFTETESEGPSDAEATMQAAATSDGLHQLDLALTWDVGGDLSAAQVSLGYRYEQGGLADGREGTRHAGTVNVALGF